MNTILTDAHIPEIRTLIIIIWFGKWPDFLPFFLKTIAFNPGFTWLIVSDQEEIPHSADNLIFRHFSIANLNKRASQKLGFNIGINNPKKLCDFKPAYGVIFSDFLEKFDYWGYCDLDMVFGNLSRFIKPLQQRRPDVISFYGDFLSGPLCLYRHTDRTINLYKKMDHYQALLGDPDHLAIDENNILKTSEIARYSNAGTKIRYLITTITEFRFLHLPPREIRYRYQWFLKKIANPFHKPYDMTEVVHRESELGKLSVIWSDLLFSDRSFVRRGRKKWSISWVNGNLYLHGKSKEIPAFHFVDLKNKMESLPGNLRDEIPDKFHIGPKGFDQ